MNVSEEPQKKVVFETPQEWNDVQLDSGVTSIQINEDLIAQLKMKESENEIKKWLKITEHGKDVGKVQVYALRPAEVKEKMPFEIAPEMKP